MKRKSQKLKVKSQTKKLKKKIRHSSSFKEKVLSVVSKIPKGKTSTYKQVAQKAGSPKAFRAVGNMLNSNFNSKIPCHRVIRSDGSVGGYNRGKKLKVQKLKVERAI